MDILIPHSWLKKFLDTKVNPEDFARYMSLCGPSVEKVTKTEDGDYLYSIEITTNRVDCAGVLGIAREASVILPRFGIKAKIKETRNKEHNNFIFSKKVGYLNVKVDEKLCPRFSAVLIKNVTVKESPKEIKSMLEKVGVRPINNIVDVSNYIMHELGQPVHTFDYDKIAGHKMILRPARNAAHSAAGGESITTLDGKTFKLSGRDIVIEDGSGKLIDLCGIMGGANSAIDENTKNVLLFVQTYNKHKIRKTSMTLSQRSEAAVLFEKGLDAELVTQGIIESINLVEKVSGGKSEKDILNLYPNPNKQKYVETSLEDQEKIIGIKLNKSDVEKYLESLGFEIIWNENKFKIGVPSFRAGDINIPEDIAEEISRIYGYQNLPNILISGHLPKTKKENILNFEKTVKQIIATFGGIEVLNLSLVDKTFVDKNALKLKNALGTDTEYLRTSLIPKLLENAKDNSFEKGCLHLFELSNVYKPTKNNLPEEILTLSGVIINTDFRTQKGIVIGLLDILNVFYQEKIIDQKIEIFSNKIKIGEYEKNGNIFTYSFELEKLMNSVKKVVKFKDISKFPPQIEDLTLTLPVNTYIGDVIKSIKSVSNFISKVDLKDIYKNNYTFNIEYHNPEKTMTDEEVAEIRNKILKLIKV